jgi:hypothetical protein
MKEATPSDRHARIDAAELNWVEVTDNGQRLCLRMLDRAGRPASVSFPVACLNAVLSAVPRSASDLLRDGRGQVHTIDSWSLGQDKDGLALTLHLPDGAKITFAVKPSQIEAMASLVGHVGDPRHARLN